MGSPEERSMPLFWVTSPKLIRLYWL